MIIEGKQLLNTNKYVFLHFCNFFNNNDKNFRRLPIDNKDFFCKFENSSIIVKSVQYKMCEIMGTNTNIHLFFLYIQSWMFDSLYVFQSQKQFLI